MGLCVTLTFYLGKPRAKCPFLPGHSAFEHHVCLLPPGSSGLYVSLSQSVIHSPNYVLLRKTATRNEKHCGQTGSPP